MGINFDFLINAAEKLTDESKADLADRGTLDPDQVLVEFHTQEDDRVRPSHEALDGTVWAPGDPVAPAPPLDYGCRCFVTYRAKPETQAASILPVSDKQAASTGAHYATYLDENLEGWRRFLASLKSRDLTRLEQMGETVLMIQKAKPELSTQDAREYARMLLQADPDVR
jgi:hypothetical protein